MSKENFKDLFSLSADDFKEENVRKVERYKPDAKKGTNNHYEAVIRFVPWYKDKKESIKDKWTGWVENVDTNEGRYIDCPSSIGEKSLLQDIFFKLRESPDVREQELQKKFSRRKQYASLVQVMEDKQQPDLEGKILVYTYGQKVHKKLMNEMQPKHGKPRIPFDVVNGRPFALEVNLVSGFNNYDESAFIDPDGYDFKFSDGTTLTKVTEASMKKLFKDLEENSPDFDKYSYQPWTDDTFNFVIEAARSIIPEGDTLDKIEKINLRLNKNAVKSKPSNKPKPATKVKPPKVEDEIPDIDLEGDTLDDLDSELYDDL